MHNPRTLRTVRRPVRAVAETDKETQAQPEPEVRTVQNEPRNLTFGNNSNAVSRLTLLCFLGREICACGSRSAA